MIDKATIRDMFAKGKEREVLLFAYLYANVSDGYTISAVEIESRFGIPKTTLNRIMKQKWNGSGMEVEWKWNKSALVFSKLAPKSGTEVERKWNESGMKPQPKPRPKKPKTSTHDYSDIIEQIVHYLNEATSKKFRVSNGTTQKLIVARIKEGFTVNDFCKVIDNQSQQWLNNEYNKYLRPQTLFGNKFESYLNSEIIDSTQKKIDFHAKISKNDKYKAAAERAREIDYGVIANFGAKDDKTDAREENK